VRISRPRRLYARAARSVVLTVALIACTSVTPVRSPTVVTSPLVPSPALPTASAQSPTLRSSSSPVALSALKGRMAYAFDDGIVVSNADGTAAQAISHDGGFDPTWSPDGTRIAYRRLLESDDGEIWLMRADGSRAHDLNHGPDSSDWGPAWSPDGARIAYSSGVGGRVAIFVMDADGSQQRALGQGHGEYPAWSPDGTRIAYAGGGYYDIYVMKADGTDQRQLTHSPAYDMSPAWSPDGRWIAYDTQADFYPRLTEPGQGPEMEIHVMRADGTDDHRITDNRVEDRFPAWSPDSAYLAWTEQGRIMVANPDGSGAAQVARGTFLSWIR
jgi:Tol biopolymer transport system component